MPKFPIEETYLEIAQTVAKRSYATRSKVGAVIVKNDNIIAYGWNGTPRGCDNQCELDDNTSSPYVLHAESNALLKCARHGLCTDGADLYLTLSPCLDCAKLIVQAGIIKVVYLEQYRIITPIEFLESLNIECIHWNRRF